MHRLVIHQLSGTLAVVRLAPNAAVPSWAWQGPIAGAIRTTDELSVVCDASVVPENAKVESGWVALMLEGPFPFSMTGVLSSVLSPLAAVGVPVFVLSTFDTDYVLVKGDQASQALQALESAGHVVHRTGV
jgi:uncharacterized protein